MKDKTQLLSWNYCFIFWFLTDAWFNHTTIGTIGQIIFMLYSLYWCYNKKEFHSSALFVIYIIFCCVCYLNVYLGHAINSTRSLFMCDVVLRNFIFLFALYHYAYNTGFDNFMKILTTACFVSSIGIILINYSRSGILYMHGDTNVAGLINANIQSVLSGFLIAYLLIKKQYTGMYKWVILLLLLFVILSGTKKSIISMGVIICMYILLKSPSHIIRNLIVVLGLFVFSYIILIKIPFIYEMIGSRFESLYAFWEGGDTDASTNTRDRFIELALLYWADNPIWGNGLDSFGVLWGDETTYSHNNYVELLCSVGLVGLISFYLLYLIPLIKLLRTYIKTHSESAILGLCILISCLVLDYAMVTYFERVPYILLVLIYILVKESSNRKILYRS